MEVFKNDFVHITYSPDKQQLTQTWKGFADSASFRQGIDSSVRICQTENVSTLLSDTTQQNVVRQADAQYAADAAREMTKSGVKALAFILSRDIFNKMTVKNLADQRPTENVRYFDSREEAESWLDKHRG